MRPASDEELIAFHLVDFDEHADEYRSMAVEAEDAARERLQASGLKHFRVEARAKGRDSYAKKLQKDPRREVEDLVGLRILVFFRSDTPMVEQVIADMLVLDEGSYVNKSEQQADQSFGYRSIQFIGHVKQGGWGSAPRLLDSSSAAMKIEVQIRTVLEHAWAEVEHDIQYKPGGASPASNVRRRFALTAALLEQADENLDNIREEMTRQDEIGVPTSRGVDLDRWVHSRFVQTNRESLDLDGRVASALGLKLLYAQKSGREARNAAILAGWGTYERLHEGVVEHGELGLRLAIACADPSRSIHMTDYFHDETPRAFKGIGLFWTGLAVGLGLRSYDPFSQESTIAVPPGRLAEFQVVAKYLIAYPDVSPLTVRDEYRPQAAPPGSTRLSDFSNIVLGT